VRSANAIDRDFMIGSSSGPTTNKCAQGCLTALHRWL
jgi:hypothetical protein